MRTALTMLACAALALSVSQTAFGRPAAMGAGCTTGTKLSAGPYKLALVLGAQEAMVTAAQAKAKHLKSGEIMLSGAMAMAMNPAKGAKTYELKLYVCTSDGMVVKSLTPTIVVSDPTAKTMGMKVAAATMIGIGMPSTDYHYGNEVSLMPGDKITVAVTVKGTKATFHAMVPKASGAGMSMG